MFYAGCRPGFPKLFFLIAPFRETKKAIAPSNKTTKNYRLKHLRPFFCSSSATQKYLV